MVMKRKVLRVGNASLAVSLPSKWVKAHGLKAGDEVEVIEEDDLTIATTIGKTKGKEVSLQIDNYSYYTLSRYLTEVYRQNCSRIMIIFTKKTIRDQRNEKDTDLQSTLKRLVRRFLGAEIVSQTQRGAEIEFFVSEDQQDLAKIEKRVYHLFNEAFTEMISSMEA